jgi:hypothetical protein
MEQLLAYREQLISRLERSVEEFCRACLETKEADRSRDGWTVHQIAVHARDADRLVYGLRARRTAQEPNPLFEDFDQDAWMAAHYDPAEPLEKVLEELKGSVLSLAEWLRGLSPIEWARESRHEVMGGGFTLQTWVERGLGHIEGHLEEVRGRGKTQNVKRKT